MLAFSPLAACTTLEDLPLQDRSALLCMRDALAASDNIDASTVRIRLDGAYRGIWFVYLTESGERLYKQIMVIFSLGGVHKVHAHYGYGELRSELRDTVESVCDVEEFLLLTDLKPLTFAPSNRG